MLFSERKNPRLSNFLKICHPERSLAIREADRPAESKDPFRPALSWATEGVLTPQPECRGSMLRSDRFSSVVQHNFKAA